MKGGYIMGGFDSNGQYQRNTWNSGDVITAKKLNDIEDALYDINENDIERHRSVLDAVHETKQLIENDISEVRNEISPIKNDRDNKYGVHKITRKTKKIFDDGCVLNVNNTGKPAEVCGFREHSDLHLYPDRDSVIMYVDGVLPKCEILEVIEFGVDYVTFNGSISEIEPGMIIDCMNQSEIDNFYQHEKYSGFVTDIIDNKIFVSGWYQYKNPNSGQIPDKNRIIINPVTRLWGTNINVFLPADSFGWGGVGCEYGLWNSKSVATNEDYYQLCGVDVANFEGVCGTGYLIRKAGDGDSNKILIGFQSKDAEQGFVSERSKIGFNANVGDSDIAYKTNNDKFVVYGDGTLRSMYVRRSNNASNSAINPDSGFFHFVDSGVHTLPSASQYGGAHIKIVAKNDCTINGDMVTNSGAINSVQLNAWITLELYSDASHWYIIKNS